MDKKQFFEQVRAHGAFCKEISCQQQDLFISCGGREVRIRHINPVVRDIPRIMLSVSAIIPDSIIVEKSLHSDRVLERIGLQGKILSGSEGLDARLHIRADNAQLAGFYFGQPGISAAVLGLFDEGCERIEFGPNGLRVFWRLSELASADLLKNCPALMNILAGVDFSKELHPRSKLLQREKTVPGVLAALNMALIVNWLWVSGTMLGMDFGVFPVNAGQALSDSVSYSIPAWVGFLAVVGVSLRGQSWFKVGFLRAAALSPLLFFMAGYWALCFVNRFPDRSPGGVYTVPVVSVKESLPFISYQATLRSWSGARDFELNITRKEYKLYRSANHRNVALLVKPGNLGYEWISDFKFTRNNAAK